MATYTNRTVNATGLAEIAAFLAAHHKLGGEHFTPDMLRAWAADAEFQLAEGNTPTIEISSRDSASGHTETFTVSDAGVDGARIFAPSRSARYDVVNANGNLISSFGKDYTGAVAYTKTNEGCGLMYGLRVRRYYV